MTLPPAMALTPGDTYISTLATYISTNSTRLASSPLPQASRRPPASSSSSSYTSYLLPPALYAGTPPKPLALRITPQNLFYLLLHFQAIGLDVGELDVPLGKDVQRAMSLVEVSSAEILRRRRDERRSETGSFRSVAGSMVSGLSLGGWWGTGGKVKDPGQSELFHRSQGGPAKRGQAAHPRVRPWTGQPRATPLEINDQGSSNVSCESRVADNVA